MLNRILIYNLVLLVLIFSFISCQGKNETERISELKQIDLKNVELFIDFEQNGMVQPVSIEFIKENRLAILDGKLNVVFIFNITGNLLTKFGGEGKGPGEFLRPLYINKTQNSINIIDADLRRVSEFDLSGEFSETYNFKENPYTTNITIADTKKYLAGALGEQNSLLKIVDLEEDSTLYFGIPKVEDQTGAVNIEEARKTLSNGEIPAMFKNDVKLYFDGEFVYAFLSAYSQLQKYNTDGTLIWRKNIDLPINEIIFDRLVERAKSAKNSVVPSFQYITSMKVVNEATYLLWAPVEGNPRNLVKVNSGGTIDAIYNIPEENLRFFDFTIDPNNKTLYLTAPGMGQIYRAELPGDI